MGSEMCIRDRLGITLLLSGCVRIDADLDLRGPDRLALAWDVRSTQERPLPWQEQFEQDLQREVPGLKIEQTSPGRQQISSRVASSHELAQLGIAAATQQPAGGDGFLVLPLAHPGGDHQEPEARPLRAVERVLLRQGKKQLQALAVVPALQGCLRFREVQCCVLLAHP